MNSQSEQLVLYYVHDPMCSWCWAYRPTWSKLKAELRGELQVVTLLGGLAPDNDQPMPAELQQTIQGHWRNIHAMLGTEFNFDFWARCQPRRDTYKACRAVVVARDSGLEEEMILAIQRAYYQRALNPSEPETLIQLASEIGMDKGAFRSSLASKETNEELRRQIALAGRFGVRSFPSLVVRDNNRVRPVSIDYKDHQVSLMEIQSILLTYR